MGYIEDLRKAVGQRPLILPGAVAVMVDVSSRILLEQRVHPEGTWGLPGGLMELGESTEDVESGEVWEETGLSIDHLHLINVYSGPENFVKAANGDEFYTVTVAYYTTEFSGEITIDKTESVMAEFFYPDQLSKKIIRNYRII
ncbi:NUDIX hydrolase [Oceanobacillus salinisoli]|uniref:NUDIX hydrolase n=1 Tax=Oceanobacillus salinisoli TaxID=2678611 RepID=UPI002F358B08